jgi:hypothetical protein
MNIPPVGRLTVGTRQVGDDRRSHHGPPGIVPAEKEPTMDIGIGYVPAIVVVFAVIWAIKGMAAFGRWASAEIDRKRNS